MFKFALTVFLLGNVAQAYDGAWGSEIISLLGVDQKSGRVYLQKEVTINGLYSDENGKDVPGNYLDKAHSDQIIYEFDRSGKETGVFCKSCQYDMRSLLKHNRILEMFSPLPSKPAKISSEMAKTLKSLSLPTPSAKSPSGKCSLNIKNTSREEVAFELTSVYSVSLEGASAPIKVGPPSSFTGCQDAYATPKIYWLAEASAVFVVEKDRKRWIPSSSCSWDAERVRFKFGLPAECF